MFQLLVERVINKVSLAIGSKILDPKSDTTNTFKNNTSLTALTSLTRVEPLTIVSKDCVNSPCLTDLLNTVLNLFAGYYLQGVATLGILDNVSVVKKLDALSPDRSSFLSLGLESIEDKYMHTLYPKATVALESENTKILNENTNLAIGKLLDIDFSYPVINDKGGKTFDSVKIPISIRLMTSLVPNDAIIAILKNGSLDNSFVERFHAWRSGRLEFIKDLIFCQDLITEYKKNLLNKDSAALLEVIKRANKATASSLITKTPSISLCSNIFILSTTAAKELERVLYGKLTNASVRSRLFEKTYAMVICVIDSEWERVNIYIRDSSAYTDLSFKELKSSNKGKGVDILDVLKSLQNGGNFL